VSNIVYTGKFEACANAIKLIPMINYWLVKSEPDAFSWDQQVANGVEPWTGVRSYQARNNLRAMKKGDACRLSGSDGAEGRLVGGGYAGRPAA
jgi:hypothetical protein